MSKRGQGEGSIYKRDDGLWVGVVNLGFVNGKRKRKYLYGETRKEVADKLAGVLRDHQQGLPVAMERQTIEEFVLRWLDESVKPHRENSTYFSYCQMARLYIIPRLGCIQVVKLTPRDIQKFINSLLEEGLSARTVQYNHAILRRALNQALRWDLIARNPATLVDLPNRKKKSAAFLVPDDAIRLIEEIQGDRLEALYTVALAIGLRKGEALGLRREDVDFTNCIINVRVALQWIRGQKPKLKQLKTEKSQRRLSLPSFAIEALQVHKRRQQAEKEALGVAWDDSWGLVFCTGHGTPLGTRNVTRSFHEMLVRAGLTRIRFYDMRHTCASLLLVQGVPLRVVMEILGHSQITLTADLYTHVAPLLLNEAAQGMDTMFGKKEGEN